MILVYGWSNRHDKLSEQYQWWQIASFMLVETCLCQCWIGWKVIFFSQELLITACWYITQFPKSQKNLRDVERDLIARSELIPKHLTALLCDYLTPQMYCIKNNICLLTLFLTKGEACDFCFTGVTKQNCKNNGFSKKFPINTPICH